ncbi:Charged multivesicular body protein 4c [Dissostichus eleginoides]|uniref:Charged multivesicular body protein 4c n=1 Tax=Dissostichus eleginoides TaxID=100907 RepID=A0AAD9F4N6_DISEL|nr:Charged multivesicular body protein 4c [Dissostichus eleginoides]
MGWLPLPMKQVHENMDIDKIDDLMQDITEQQDVAREISDAISGPFGETFDEDELLADVPSGKLPSARPSSHRATTKKRVEDEDDMRTLASWAT